MVGIAVVGAALVVYSRASIPNNNTPPTVEDHWHVSYGFNACNSWLPDLQGNKEETDSAGQLVSDEFRRTGIHSHNDGVVHWHAYSSAATGRNAKLGVFLDVYGVKLSDSKIQFPDDQGGAVYEEGVTKCTDADGKQYDAEIAVYVFDSFDDGAKYTTYITNFDDIRIKQDGMAIQIAFNKAGTKPELPPSAANLPELGAADTAGATTTTVADETTTTVAGEPTTTVAGATTTVAAAPTSSLPVATTLPSGTTTTSQP